MNNSDYSEKRTNLNDLIPQVNKSNLLEAINENLFNRYLTSPETVRYIGNVGDIDSGSNAIKNIKEPNNFRQENQLQPIIQNTTGTVKSFLSFQEFYSKLKNSGVDMDTFSDWASVLQFNWNPPIDFDKIINYRDYFWNSSTTDPDYITVKNTLSQSRSRFQSALASIFEILPQYEITSNNISSINIAGNNTLAFLTGDYVIISSDVGDYILSNVFSSSYSAGTQSTTVNVLDDLNYTVNRVVNPYIEIISFNSTLKQFTTSGNVSALFKKDYVFSVYGNYDIDLTNGSDILLKVLESTYNTLTNTTTIIVDDLQDLITSPQYLNCLPLVFLLQGEIAASDRDNRFDYKPNSWSLEDISYIWSNNINVIDSELNGYTTLGTNIFDDTTVDFISSGVQAGDTLLILAGAQIGSFNIVEVFENSLKTDHIFFAETAVQYSVNRSGNILNIPAYNNVNQLKYDDGLDQLQIYDGSTWNTVLYGVSKLISVTNSLNFENRVQNDEWSLHNHWVHRDQIKDITDRTRAQIPIIEFEPFLEMADTSYTSHQWDYIADDTENYALSEATPTLFELHDISLGVGDEFIFSDYNTIIFHEKFGNFASEYEIGSEIVFSGFVENNGVYKIANKQYVKVNTENRYVTIFTLFETLSDISDVAIGGRITPRYTKHGDVFNYDTKHWRFKGVKDISSSSINWTRNPMLDELAYSYDTLDLYTNVFLSAQEIKYKTTVSAAMVIFDELLQNVVLYDDYQEGDIRVYINGVRQYGNFTDIDGTVNDNYVGGIQFDASVTLTDTDVLRIEVGEYFLEDVGRRDVLVYTTANNEITGNYENYNLVRLRKMEQKRFDRNSYPFFKLFNMDSTPSTSASEIFKYVEDAEMPVNPYIFRRIKFDYLMRNFFFDNLLNSEGQKLLAYKINNKLYSVWHHGLNNELIVPKYIDDNWDILDPWYYNIEHENRKNVSVRDIFQHATSCISNQEKNNVYFSTNNSKYYLHTNPNKILGGTIKEHNGGLDSLVSALFTNSGTPTSIINFAGTQYNSSLNYLKEIFRSILPDYIQSLDTTTAIDFNGITIDAVIDVYENNDRFNELYGDSLNHSIKNFISSASSIGVFEKVVPHLIRDENGEYLLVHHDGHISKIIFTSAEKEQIIQGLSAYITQTVPYSFDAFPISNNIGEILVRTDLEAKTRKIYKSSETYQWFEIDIVVVLSNLLLEVEERLYADCNPYSMRYDFTNLQSKTKYNQFQSEQFFKYCDRLGYSHPLQNSSIYKANNAFTWNYFYTAIPDHPLTNAIDTNTYGCWQALYEYVYGTAYPHEQPWMLQGFNDKPSWWDTEYLNTDVTIDRKWKYQMWANVLSGVVPNGRILPNGDTSTGAIYQIAEVYQYVPVNILNTPTSDGYAPDSLLPPYWNSNNTTSTYVRTLFDINSGYGVNTPNLDYEFGQVGTMEWMWKKSIWYNYDLMTIAYKLDPIAFFNAVFDSEFYIINCLEVDKNVDVVRNHKNTIFHGELIDNVPYKSPGINQWYIFFNRYSAIDGNVSAFKDVWRGWKQNLSYLFSGMIDTNNVEIFNYNFDLTDKDYSIDIDKSKSFDSKQMTGLNATLLSVPSKYNKNRDTGIGWTTEFSSLGQNVSTIELYKPQVFDFYVDATSDIFTTGRYQIAGADIAVPNGYQIIDFSQTFYNSYPTGLSNTNFTYHADVIVDATNTINLHIKGYKSQTVVDLLSEINLQLAPYANASLYYGDIKIQSNMVGILSSISITDAGLFASVTSFNEILPPDISQYEFLKVFEIYKNVTRDITKGSTISIVGSTQFNGDYSVLNSYYNPQTQMTSVFVSTDITVSSAIVDGYLIPESARTLPDTWQTGVELFVESGGILPSPLDPFTPYYLIRLDDYSFKLANNPKAAKSNMAIDITGVGTGAHTVGKLLKTFKALSGSITNYPWRVYESDKREITKQTLPAQTSGIQDAVNFLIGYNDKLYDAGIKFTNIDSDNKDTIFNRTNDWQFFIEKFISWAYQIRAIRQADTLKFRVLPNISENTLDMQDGAYVNWPHGTEVVFSKDAGAILPVPFDNPLSEYIPYYIIRTNSSSKIQLALSTYDALNGRCIDISSSGSGTFYIQTINDIVDYPSITLNPCRYTTTIEHPQGIISDIFNRVDYYFEETPVIYNTDGEVIHNGKLILYRNDKQTKMTLTKDIIDNNNKTFTYSKRNNPNDIISTSVTLNNNITEIGGFKLFLDSYEHIMSFNDLSVDGSLIFDRFLGIRTPRFYLEYSRSPNFTLRPNVGGHVMHDFKMVENLEHAVDSLRNLYDTYTSVENRSIVQRARKTVNYDGPKDYMDDLQINDKSQFIFWRGMIQNKGTNVAVDAFVNQPIFEEAGVDEFWAYKLATFGDNKEKVYPELKLFTRDVSTKEARLEFVTPDGGALDETFETVKLTDLNRWWNQPDQLYSLAPKPSFYFDAEVTSYTTGVEDLIETVNRIKVFKLPKKSDKVIVTFYDRASETTKQLSENYDYYLLNTDTLVFVTGTSYQQLSVSTLSYNYDAQNPATLIDKKSETVMRRIPIWHPAIDQHYHISNFVVDYKDSSDMAVYNFDGSNEHKVTWLKGKENSVWLDTSKMYYIPYYDSNIFPDINYRIFNWGRMAEFGQITMYQWTESLVAPENWANTVSADAKNKNLLQDEKRSGEVYSRTYRNIQENTGEDPVWIEHKDEIFEFVTALVEPETTPENTLAVIAKVYVNGFYNMMLDITEISLYEFCYGVLLDGQISKPRAQDIITLVFEAPIPTQTELDAGGVYKKEYPYSFVTKIDELSHQEYKVYYFWVKNKDNRIAVTGDSYITLKEAQRQMQYIPIPYMLLQGLRTPEFGYGLVYGVVFDEDSYELPYRYTQLVIKGLENTVKDDERYCLRFTRDFTLRDSLPGPNSLYSPLYLKNVHVEWKLIREKQLAKIDLFLWDRIAECIIGKQVIAGNIIEDKLLPTLNRTVYDNLYGTDTKYGLGVEQIFMEGDLAKSIVLAILNNPDNTFLNVDINTFLLENSLDTDAAIIKTLYGIYNSFTTEEINRIYFELLHAAMSQKKHHSEIFKTSWVALQATQNVYVPSNGKTRSQSFVDGECPL